MDQNHTKPSVWKGAVAGLVAGLVASWAMDRFQDLWLSLSSGDNLSDSHTGNFTADEANTRIPSADESEDDATRKAAAAISETIFGHKLTPQEKKIAGHAIHYAVGAAAGVAYGVIAERFPQARAGFGLPYGSAFWLTIDEGAVPLLGLSKGPTEYPLSTHTYALVSHLAFGVAAEFTRRAVRTTL